MFLFGVPSLIRIALNTLIDFTQRNLYTNNVRWEQKSFMLYSYVSLLVCVFNTSFSPLTRAFVVQSLTKKKRIDIYIHFLKTDYKACANAHYLGSMLFFSWSNREPKKNESKFYLLCIEACLNLHQKNKHSYTYL
jgi:hypothetical protein